MNPTRRAQFLLPASLLLVVLVAAAVLLVAMSGPLARATRDAQRLGSAELSPWELEARNKSAFARVMGEFRASAADVMFVKTERYLHGGMSRAPHLDADKMAASGVVVDKGVNVNSEILVEEVDFRGFLGNIERAVKPFDMAHRHTDTTELLPWYRLMTVMDPHYVRGYRIGTYWLIGRPDAQSWIEAIKFLDEGIDLNNGAPEEFRLWTSRALYYQKRYSRALKEPDFLGDDPEAMLEKTLESARKCYQLGLAERPATGEENTFGPRLLWTPDLEEDFRFGARYIPTILRELGRLDEALAEVKRVRDVVPDDTPLRNMQQSIEAEISKRAAEAPAS